MDAKANRDFLSLSRPRRIVRPGCSHEALDAMKDRSSLEIAARLALTLSPGEREALRVLQERLASVLSRLWNLFAELLESQAVLTAGREAVEPVDLADFRPGATVRLGASIARTDPRLVLAERLNVDAWADLIGELAEAVLHAPDLARQELLAVLADLDEEILRQIGRRFDEEDATKEFPAQPVREHA